MLQKIKEVMKTKKLVLALGLAGVLAFTSGVYVSANTEISQEPVIAENITTEEEEMPTIDTPEVSLVNDEEVPVDEDTEVIEEDATTEVDASVSLAEAEATALAEHQGVIKFNKTKTFNDQNVYKFYYNDGWKVYVSVEDGEVVRIIEASHRDSIERAKDGVNNREWGVQKSLEARSR